MEFTLLAEASTTTNGPYTTASITPLANREIIIGIGATVATGQVTPAELDIVGCGITWSTIRTSTPARTGVYLVKGMSSSPTPGTLSISGVGISLTGIAYAIAMSDATVDSSGGAAGAVVQSFVKEPAATTTISEAFEANGGVAPNAANGAIAAIQTGVEVMTTTAGTGWTKLSQVAHSGPQNNLTLMYASSAKTVLATQSVSTGPALAAAEIKAAGGGGPSNLDRLKLGSSILGLRVGVDTPSKVYAGAVQIWP